MNGIAIPPFRLSVERSGATARIVCAGELDVATEGELESLARRVIASRPEAFVIDLSALTFVDSCGLRRLIAVDQECRAAGVGLSIRSTTALDRLLEITGYTAVLPLSHAPRPGG